MPSSQIIGTSEQVAQRACDYSRSYILMGSTQLVTNSYLAIQQYSLRKALFDLRYACRESRIYALEIDKAIKRFYQTIDLCKKYSLGNCYELALMALDYVVHFAPQVDAEVYYIIGGDHAFLVIGKEKNSHPNKPETWGNNAYICDPWANDVYPASQYRARTKNFYRTLDSQSGTYINQTQNFNPLRHSLSPMKNASTQHIRQTQSEHHLKKIVKFFEEKNTYILNAMNFLEGRLTVIVNRLIENYGKDNEKSMVISKVMEQLNNSAAAIRESINEKYNLSDYRSLRDTLENSLKQNVNAYVQAVKISQKDYDALYQYHNKSAFSTFILQFFNIPPITVRLTKEALRTATDEVQRVLQEDSATWSIK
ncbi:hypothetical protein [Legionella bononiensis]|uniref:Uncharacterized protein n=1 Tax=Legionella bononiensis TaxID=2793102 RepID=A0ABS1W6J8_9GAMM|nr:hypothetical protein [Legionella bononiensis]MBL7478395.1 hypothetical protein [Legionella bononiensis]MBL7524992.1 hypothetical protein [Legionella bononiensis]MBL7561289.1 hypothetical protein [Legionella bononiensis]